MKKALLSLILIQFHLTGLIAQQIPPSTEQQLENLAQADEVETEDDSYIQELERFKRDPLDLNSANEADLGELKIISDAQIRHFLAYRMTLGKLISLYELQAIPGWDLNTIRKILPFVTISSAVPAREDIAGRLKKGDHELLLRVAQGLEKSSGFRQLSAGRAYPGSPQKILFRYRYRYKNLLQFGLLGDKDAGEQLFKGAQRQGFDFYSFHLFTKKTGRIQALALGDFTVNMGQGLIQWQTLAFKKGADLTSVKRQSPVLRAYNSPGEYNFHRGAAITVRNKNTDLTVFASIRQLDANYNRDTLSNVESVSSILVSGLNRTAGEIADKNRLRQTSLGGSLKYSGHKGHVAFNGIYYRFSLPLLKRDEPYNLFALKGDRWHNLSADYGYTVKNIHLFGEAAVDKNLHKAFIQGVLLSVDPRVDIGILYRRIEKEYQAINANAFTENSSPSNESGLFAGISIRPAGSWQLTGYADIFHFPWLRYQADAPGYGKDFLLQLAYSPARQTEIYLRYRTGEKPGNEAGNSDINSYEVRQHKQNLRLHIAYAISRTVVLSKRVDMIWYDRENESPSKGFLCFLDIKYKPLWKPYSGSFRLQYFETDDYNSKLYTYESDVLYSNSIPVFYDKGYRLCVSSSCDISRRFTLWIRWVQTIYPDKNLIGSGPDEITGNKKSEIKWQLRFSF